MRKRHIAVAVKEEQYLQRLAEYLRHSAYAEEWHLTAFTSALALKQYIRGNYPLGLIAAQPAFIQELRAELEQAGVPVVALVSDPGAGSEGSSGQAEVRQYQPIPALLGSLAAKMGAIAGGGADGDGERKTQVISIYSASGGEGKTTLALNLAHQLGARGLRTFYLNMELWNSVHLPDANEDMTLAALLYVLQSDPSKAQEAFTRLRKHEGLWRADYLLPSPNLQERLHLTPELATRLVEAIAAAGDYDAILIDLPSAADPVVQALLTCSNRILWLASFHLLARRKLQLAREFAGSGNEQKIRWILASRTPAASEEQSWPGGRVHGCLPRVPELADIQTERQLIASATYRGAVEKLIDGLIDSKRGR